ncbi:MAG: 3-phosphoserine/phosphohydroxythreonine transaminase [Eggerthellaceae bacterium]|nr:3-phosphoserine/phosphohydroxythreonine transaminase [Eggerthellaceae bacterium]
MREVFNFSAGPAMLPEPVLKQAHDEMFDFCGSGMSAMEISHRSAEFDGVIQESKADLRELLNIPENYDILYLQGGASVQFAGISMNLAKSKKADYIVSGTWSNKACKEADYFVDAKVVASSTEQNFSTIPDVTKIDFRDDADYTYFCMNETIQGTHYAEFPEVKNPLVADVSSCFLSEPLDVSKFGIVFGGVQKNIGPAGLAILIICKDLIRPQEELAFKTPTMMVYKTHADAGSLYNTPAVWTIYICSLVFKWLKNLGGLEVMREVNIDKAKVLYDYLDASEMFTNPVEKKYRSLMNVPFVTGREDLDKKFILESSAEGLLCLKGHRSVGGMRASIYNAMPREGVEKLVAFMKDFEAKNSQ